MTQNSSTFSFNHYLSYLIASSVLLVLGFLTASEWLVRQHVIPNDSFTGHLSFLSQLQKNDKPSTFSIGDSHIAYGVQGSEALKNIAYPGDNIDDMYFKASLFASHSSKNKVILQADPHLFARYRLTSKFEYMTFLDLEETSSFKLHILSPYHKSKILHYWKAYLIKGGLVSSDQLNSIYGGIEGHYNWAKMPAKDRFARAKDRATLHKPISNIKSHSISSTYEKTIRTLIQNDVTVCLVTFPVTKEYYDSMAKLAEYQNALAYYRLVAEEFGLPYKNHLQTFKQEAHLFNDEDHLNKQGNDIFTARLVADCFSE